MPDEMAYAKWWATAKPVSGVLNPDGTVTETRVKRCNMVLRNPVKVVKIRNIERVTTE